MKQNKTYQLGAAHERQAALSHLRRLRAKIDNDDDPREAFTDSSAIATINGIIDWIKERTKRFEAKPGGLGRKRKAAKSVACKIKCAFGCKVPSV